jgi:hypothetical protein
MSNDYYEHPETFIPGDLARAEDVENEFKRVESAFGMLPDPRPDGLGFSIPIFVGQATDDDHAANWGQLKELEALSRSHAEAAEQSKIGSETAEQGAQTARQGAETAEANALSHADDSANSATTALGHANQAGASAALANEWATKTSAPVAGSDYGAKYYSNKSKDWASGSGEIEPGLKSAKGYAEEAAAIVAGARTYIGLWDASGGTYPIPTPVSGDEGKYWVISVAGTLPLGAVDVGWELSINDSLAYEAANLLPSNLVTQVNGKSGPNVNLSEADIPDIASTYLAAANYTAADVLAKVKTVDGAGSGLDADTLDGFHASYFLPSSTYTATDVLNKLKTVDGAGSGLDADTLDGQQASAFFPASGVSSFGASLVDDANASAARNTLGLGTAATQNTGTGAGAIPIRDGSGNVPGNVTGNAATATKLAIGRTINITGDGSGSATFDGSGNINIPLNVNDNSHNHDSIQNWGNYTAPFNNANNTPRAFFAAGLCRAFVRSADGWPVSNGTVLNIPSYTSTQDGGALQILSPYQSGQTTNNNIMWRVGLYNNSGWTAWKSGLDKDFADSLYLAKSGTAAAATKLANARTLSITGDGSGSTTFDGTSNRSINLSLVASNLLQKLLSVDGAGSGLDADLLDGVQGSGYLKKSEFSPNQPRLVWSGSATKVAISALSERGPGLYLVKSGTSVYAITLLAESDKAWGCVSVNAFGGTADVFGIRYDDTTDEFLFTKISITQSTGVTTFTNEAATISAIYKV